MSDLDQSDTAKLNRIADLLKPRLVADALHPNDPPRKVHPVHIRARDLRAVLGAEDQEDET